MANAFLAVCDTNFQNFQGQDMAVTVFVFNIIIFTLLLTITSICIFFESSKRFIAANLTHKLFVLNILKQTKAM
jgi:hypothetical protein